MPIIAINSEHAFPDHDTDIIGKSPLLLPIDLPRFVHYITRGLYIILPAVYTLESPRFVHYKPSYPSKSQQKS